MSSYEHHAAILARNLRRLLAQQNLHPDSVDVAALLPLGSTRYMLQEDLSFWPCPMKLRRLAMVLHTTPEKLLSEEDWGRR